MISYTASNCDVPQREPLPRALPGPKILLAANSLPSPTLPRLAYPDEAKRLFPSRLPPNTVPTHVLPPPTPAQPTPLTTPQSSSSLIASATTLPHHNPPTTSSLSLVLHMTRTNNYASPTTPQSTSETFEPSGAYYSPVATALGPATDGFEDELQCFLDGVQSWRGGASALCDFL